ncbi:hypothetical protein F5Y17DRAFT_135312 [Xylariaceae sp. FL0594]|nr:hypothetical protein F5Y17DRAFT_135312 [Xylariaceae sp. FL0594]
MSLRLVAAAVALAFSSLGHAAGQTGPAKEVPAGTPSLGTDTVAGCFNALADMKLVATNEFNAQGLCARQCRESNKPVGATYSRFCYCGTMLPNKKNLLDDSKCNEPCPGYGTQACGGLNAYTVYNTGLVFNVPEADFKDVSSSSTTSTPTPTPTSKSPDPIVVTATPTATSEPPKKESSSKTVGIAVGVVVGVVAVIAIIATSLFYVRRKRNAQLEEEHRRNAAVNAFISGGKAPSSSNMSIADSRMDPVMTRRMSDGSIADNQDYSRRILRVTNV